MDALVDGLTLVVKKDCPTCRLVEPVVGILAAGEEALSVYSQDDPAFPETASEIIDDSELEFSYRNEIEIVPTLIRVKSGEPVARIEGWNRDEWREFTGLGDLGEELPPTQPGCGSLSVEPGMAERLAVRFGDSGITARPVDISPYDDVFESMYDRGWSDGLPLVPPTEERVYRMLQGTKRDPGEVVGKAPPDLQDCSIQKIAINAVMAGCKPEYMPVVIAAVEGALQDRFCMHGLLATTYFSGPMLMVNGPITARIGMNWKGNAFGQGNRANATIGRALQLVIRNVGGGRPQGVDRANLGTPGKYSFCFAENEEESPWESLAEERGIAKGKSAVTLFAGDGIHPIVDQRSRSPEELVQTYARALPGLVHFGPFIGCDAFLVVCPEHGRIFREAGWKKAQLHEGIAEAGEQKFRPGGLHIVHVGGGAGMFSALIGGWVASGEIGSQSVTQEITE